jgi:hypothetical protein
MAIAFISHTSSDDAFVEKIAKRLEAAGVGVWVDSGRIVPGDDILQKIEDGLSSATHVIVVLSPSSLISDWVREETHSAQLAAIAGTARLIPIIYGAISPLSIPFLLRSRLYVDFRQLDKFDQSITQLLSAFAEQAKSDQVSGSLDIGDVQISFRPRDRKIGIEMLLANPGKRTANIRKIGIRSITPYMVSYASPPPTLSFPIKSYNW